MKFTSLLFFVILNSEILFMKNEKQLTLFSEEVLNSLEEQSAKSLSFYEYEGINVSCMKCKNWKELRFLFHIYGITECQCHKNNER